MKKISKEALNHYVVAIGDMWQKAKLSFAVDRSTGIDKINEYSSDFVAAYPHDKYDYTDLYLVLWWYLPSVTFGVCVTSWYALKKNAETCPSRNSYCLNEVFCPECPLENGGLSVHR